MKNFTTRLSHTKDLGIRADITPQVVRLDYQSYENKKSNKYSYMGDIYRETSSPFDRNNPFQVGAEFLEELMITLILNFIKCVTRLFHYHEQKE